MVLDAAVVCWARRLSAGYGRRRVFESLDLELGQGVTALLGPNGAGKTTLLSLLCGLRRPSSGELEVLGVSPGTARGRRQVAGSIGFRPQTFGFYPGYGCGKSSRWQRG